MEKRVKYQPQRKKPLFKRLKKVQPTSCEVERKPLGEVCKENNVDMTKVSKMVNLSFLLADVIAGLVFDVESELKKADPMLGLELRHPIERIKIHSQAMVKFVDNTLNNEEASFDFGEKSEEIRTMLENHFK